MSLPRNRNEWKFFAVLPKADRRWRPRGGRSSCCAACCRRLRHRHGRARRRGAARRRPRRRRSRSPASSSSCCRCSAPIHHGGRRQPRRPHRGVALRPADRGVRAPAGHGPSRGSRSSTSDLTVARDFDLGMTGPPLSISMDFIAGGLVELIGGVASALSLRVRWWAPLVLAGAWLATHWLLRESARLARPQHRRGARGAARRRLRLPARRRSAGEQGAAAVRPRRLDDRPLRRARARRCTSCSTRRRGCARSRCCGACSSCSAPTSPCSGRSRSAVVGGSLDLGALVVFAQCAVGVVADRVRRVQLGARRRGGAGRRGAAARARRWRRRARCRPATARPTACRRARSAFATCRFAYPGERTPVLDGFDLTIPAGSSLAIVGQNGAGKTTLAKLLCRLYDPQSGAIEVDGVDLRELDARVVATRVTAVFQDFIRFELPLRDNVAPAGAPDDAIRARARSRPAPSISRRSTPFSRAATTAAPISRAASGSASRWRARCAPCELGAGVVLLDEPTAQLDVRGEAEIFERILAATRQLHDDPHLAPLLDRAPRRSHLRARARPRRRARHARRADGAGRPLPDDVRPAGAALRRAGGGGDDV